MKHERSLAFVLFKQNAIKLVAVPAVEHFGLFCGEVASHRKFGGRQIECVLVFLHCYFRNEADYSSVLSSSSFSPIMYLRYSSSASFASGESSG